MTVPDRPDAGDGCALTAVGSLVAAVVSFIGGVMVLYAVPGALGLTAPGDDFCERYSCGIGAGFASVLLLLVCWVAGLVLAPICVYLLTRRAGGEAPSYRRAAVVGLVLGAVLVLVMLGLDLALFLSGEIRDTPPG